MKCRTRRWRILAFRRACSMRCAAARSIKVGQVLTMDPDQLLSIRNFGPRSLKELRDKLSRVRLLAGRRYQHLLD